MDCKVLVMDYNKQTSEDEGTRETLLVLKRRWQEWLPEDGLLVFSQQMIDRELETLSTPSQLAGEVS